MNTHNKKNILILSDTHRMYDIEELIQYELSLNSQQMKIIHAGDSEIPFNDSILQRVDYKVRGNCDFDDSFPNNIIDYIDNLGNIFISHGHIENVKIDTNELITKSTSNNSNLVVYGHSHILDIQYFKEKDLLLINPGSTSLPKNSNPPTYISLNHSKDEFEVLVKHAQTFSVLKKLKFYRN